MNKKVLSLGLGFCLATMIVACGGSSGTDSNSENSGDNGYDYEKKSEGFLKMGSMVDPRDDQTYKTIRVGDQLWMAEDLMFVNPMWKTNSSETNYSNMYGDIDVVAYPALAGLVTTAQAENNATPGSYTYEQAMDNNAFMDSTYNDGMCPPGWHLPTMEEYDVFWGVVSTMCDSVSYCSLGEKMWSQETKYYWTSTPANGIRINTDHGYKYESNSKTAVCYKIDFSDRKPVEADFAGKSNLRAVRCVQGAHVDSVKAYESYLEKFDAYLDQVKAQEEAERRADSVKKYIEKGAKVYFNEALDYGYFTDERDGNVYGYLKIGTYTWMAENLRYYFNTYTYCNSYLSCNTFINKQQDSAYYYKVGLTYSSEQKNRACPDGWHLPSNDEWNDLLATAASTGDLLARDGVWNNAMMSPTNATGFTMVATDKDYDGYQKAGSGSTAQFWSSNEQTFENVKIDTVYVEDSTDVPADTPLVDIAVADDIAAAPDTVLISGDSLEMADSLVVEIPEKKFILDTTYTTKKVEYIVKRTFSPTLFYGFQVVSADSGDYHNSSNIRCVMDY